VSVVAEGWAGACGTGTMRALLPCKNALPSGSPETVNTAVALQLPSKTWVAVVIDVFIDVFARCFAGAGAAVPRSLLLLLLLVLLVGVRAGTAAARWEGHLAVSANRVNCPDVQRCTSPRASARKASNYNS
jgi:hypothetical protein